ncbi:MAG: prepilin-type N-terminal cleavage/methylation domain-containing protein [Phycisphaerae bacterium]
MQHTHHHPRANRRGLTLLELLVVVLIIAFIIALLLPVVGRVRPRGHYIPESSQVRGIHPGQVLFAQNSNNVYPIPSELDRANTTLTADSAKDDPGNMLSILLYNGFFSPELLVSPSEQAMYIEPISNYALSSPPNAADPAQALWDPSFRGSTAEHGFATTTGGAGIKPVGALAPADTQPAAYPKAHTSFAWMPFFGKRAANWTNNFIATQAVLGNRGPGYRVSMHNGKPVSTLISNTTPPAAGFTADVAKGTSSITLAIHGSRNTWEGHIAYNDNSVRFETDPAPTHNPFTFVTGTNPPRTSNPQPDNLFVSEDDAMIVGDSYPVASDTSVIGPADTQSLTGVNPLRNANNYLKTWVVQSVGPRTTPTGTSYAATDAITFVID